MRQLLAAVSRREIDLVAALSVDRLGLSLLDMLSILGELHAKGIDLYLHQQGLDTTTPAGRALFSMLGLFGEFERSIIRERIVSISQNISQYASVVSRTLYRITAS